MNNIKWQAAREAQCLSKLVPKSGRGLGHVTPTIFGSMVGYPSDSLASCFCCCYTVSFR